MAIVSESRQWRRKAMDTIDEPADLDSIRWPADVRFLISLLFVSTLGLIRDANDSEIRSVNENRIF